MNKISRQDLEQLFTDKRKEQSPGSPEKKISIRKARKSRTDDLILKSVRKSIHKISHKKKSGFDTWGSILKFTAITGFLGFIIFFVLSYPAYFNQIKWMYYVDYLGESIPVSNTPTPVPSPSPTIKNQLVVPNLDLKSKEEGSKLKIPKISVFAPIIWDVEESKILDELKNGVVHYAGTSRPAEDGNIFIVGHSSNYFWIKSEYNQIFSLLDKLSVGDRIEIEKNGKSYFYDVFVKKEIGPQDVEVLKSPNQILTLMTCWPVGTSINRLIVQANFAYAAN